MNDLKPVIGIACGIFEREIENLVSTGELVIPFFFMNSTLHMHPDQLNKQLTQVIEKTLLEYDNVLLVYGDCHPYICDGYDDKRVSRVQGINCCEIVMGKEHYRYTRKQGAFIVLEEWTKKWKEIFVTEIGLTEKNAATFMNDMHKKIVYLDTGVSPVPYDILSDMSQFFQLPLEIEKTSLTFLKNAVLSAYKGVINNGC